MLDEVVATYITPVTHKCRSLRPYTNICKLQHLAKDFKLCTLQ